MDGKGAYIGDTQLGVIPTTYNNVGAVRIYGQAMAGQLNIDGIIGTAAPFPVDVAFAAAASRSSHFVDLNAKLGAPETLQAWAIGHRHAPHRARSRPRTSPRRGSSSQRSKRSSITAIAKAG